MDGRYGVRLILPQRTDEYLQSDLEPARTSFRTRLEEVRPQAFRWRLHRYDRTERWRKGAVRIGPEQPWRVMNQHRMMIENIEISRRDGEV